VPCLYRMLLRVAAIVLFSYTTLYNLDRGHLPTPARWRPAIAAAVRVHIAIPTAWLLILAVLIVHAFWFYRRTLL
jgi:hypothetical protein